MKCNYKFALLNGFIYNFFEKPYMEKDIEEYISAFQKQFSEEKKKDSGNATEFLKFLVTNGKPKAAVLEFALRKMEKFSEADGFLFSHYCRQIIEKYSGPNEILRVKKLRRKFPHL